MTRRLAMRLYWRRRRAGSARVNKRQVWATIGVCFLAKAVMALDCGSGALRAKMDPERKSGGPKCCDAQHGLW